MISSDSRRFFSRLATALAILALVLVADPARAQGPGEAPAGYTEARSWDLRGEARLPGTVESLQASVVAAEVAGQVIAVEAQEGDRVRKGQTLVRLRPRWYELQLEEARGRLQESRARFELADSRLKRARSLFAEEVISQQDLDDAVSDYTAWEGQEAQIRSQIDQLEYTLERLRVRAPFAGVVTDKRTEVGQWVASGGEVMELVALDRLEVRVDVPERFFARLEPGTTARVTFTALPGLDVTGRVERIVPRADERARSFPVKVSIANPEGRIGVGMLAEVALPIGEVATATIVPKDAVIRQGPGEAVYRINAEGMVEIVPVSTGGGAGVWIAVSGEIAPGDRVITRGNERLRPGQPVTGRPQEYPLP